MAATTGYSDLWGDYGKRKRSKRYARVRSPMSLPFLEEEVHPLDLLAEACLAEEGADSESEISEPRKRVKREQSSISPGDPGIPAEAENFRASDTEAALPAGRQFDGPPPPGCGGLHYNGASLPGGASSNFRGNLTTSSLAAAQPGINSHADSHPAPPKETFIPGQTLHEKRCASHVYIARFIEYQTNKLRLQQPRQRPAANGYATLQAAEAPERGNSGLNGTFHKASLPMLADPSAAHPPAHSQVPLSAGLSNPYTSMQQFPTSSLPLSMQGLPPQYAQMLAQQHNSMSGMAAGFPFLQGLQFNGSLAQQQAAVASALASQQNMMDLEKLKALVPLGGSLNGMPPHLMAALSSFSQNALNGKQGGPPPQAGSMPQPPRLKIEQQNGARPQNGTALKMEDDSPNLQRMGVVSNLMSSNGQSDAPSAMDHYMLLEAFKKGQIPHLPLEPWGGLPGNHQKL